MPFATFSRFEIELPRDDAEAGYHTGRCDDDIESLRYVAHVRAQLDRLDPDALRAELKEYGAWDDDELSDHDANLTRILWLACGNIVEDA